MAASFFKLFPSEYQSRQFTKDLSATEAGIFFRVFIIDAWKDGGIVYDDDQHNAHVAGVSETEWKQCLEKLMSIGIVHRVSPTAYAHGDMPSKHIRALRYSETQKKNSLAKQMKYEKKITEELEDLSRPKQPIY